MTLRELEALRDEITAHPANAWARELGWDPVYVARPDARILVIGQAPGVDAQESGIPWNDASGARLISWLGVDEPTFRDPSLFAIVPMDFYFPGRGHSGHLPPRADFAPLWHPRLLPLLPHVELTLLIGGHAQRFYLEDRRPLTERVRAFRDFLPERLPLVHPSPLNFRWQARNPWFEAEVVPALRARVAEVIGRAARR